MAGGVKVCDLLFKRGELFLAGPVVANGLALAGGAEPVEGEDRRCAQLICGGKGAGKKAQ